MRIYLADLGHNLLTYSSDTYPLGVANLATWIRARGAVEPDADIRIFREPQDLKAALDETAPDVLALSNYAWNHFLSMDLARYAKGRNPDMLTVIGGPNWPLTVDVQEEFVRSMPWIDVALEGPTYEGERAFEALVRRFTECGGSIAGLKEAPFPGSVWLDAGGDFVKGSEVPRIEDLDDIPSPYLEGLMDPFFATGYFPLLQITRGCPFSCTFCNSGVASNSRVHAHSVENVKQDLLYIAERVKPEINLCFADDNFGMYPRDEEIADYIAWLQDTHGWPRYIRTTTGKNNGERIIKVMRKVRGTLPMTAAVQSMNPEVLRNIKRSNIKLDTYTQIQDELKEQGMQSYGELILCLPGETKASFMKAVEDFLDAGAKRISAHQLMLLHGAELANPESRSRFGFVTKHRLVARNIGNYTGEPVTEVEEMVVATPQFSYDDYLSTRVFHLLLTVFYYEGNLEELFEFGKQHGVRAFDVVVRMQEMLDEAPEAFRAMVEDFVREGEEELFDSPEECIAWAKQHYDRLVNDEVGGNLLSKYSMIGRFIVTGPALRFAAAAMAAALDESGADWDRTAFEGVVTYLDTVLLRTPFAECMAEVTPITMTHDVDQWRNEGFVNPLADYAHASPRELVASVDGDHRTLISTKIETFGEHPSGLGKFTRTMFAQDLRKAVAGTDAR